MLRWWHGTSRTRYICLRQQRAHGHSQHGILPTPYRQQCSPSTCHEAMPFLPAAMKCLWGRARWLLDAFLHLTLSLDKNPEQWMSTWNSLEEVVIIINREKVSMHISISNHHFQVGYMMDVKNQFVEVFKLSWLVAIQREPSELCPKLQEKANRASADVSPQANAPVWHLNMVYITFLFTELESHRISQVGKDFWDYQVQLHYSNLFCGEYSHVLVLTSLLMAF